MDRKEEFTEKQDYFTVHNESDRIHNTSLFSAIMICNDYHGFDRFAQF